MKSIRGLLIGTFFSGSLILGLHLLHAQETATSTGNVNWSSASDLEVMLRAVEETTPASGDSSAQFGTFWSAKHAPGSRNPWPPLPANMNGLPLWNLGENVWLVDDFSFNYHAALTTSLTAGGGMHAMDDSTFPDGYTNSGSGGSPYYITGAGGIPYDTNGLWLQITNDVDGVADLNLYNATDYVYAVWSTTNLSTNFPTGWQVETEVFPTDTNCMPFTVENSGRSNLFLYAEDWTGVTENGNTTPDWWFWEYFGTVDLSDTNLDSFGSTFLNDYSNNIDPNVIMFSLQFTNNYCYASPAYGDISIQGGEPFYEAMLVNDTNQADAIWQSFSSTNLAVNFGSSNGLYTVYVGLRGLAPNEQQTWIQAQLTYNASTPTFIITNPVSSTVTQPVIQLQGLVNETLSNLTFSLSNALGVVSNQQGYWQPVFYDTNLMDFTTNSFQCYDIVLTNGLNVITLQGTDLAGNTTTTNVSFTLDYSDATNPPALTIVWPQDGTYISGSNFTVQSQVDDDTATVTAQITDVNGDTNTVQGLVERSGLVWAQNLPLAAGTNILTVTASNVAGNVTTTNLTLIQSEVTVTMDPLSSDQANQPSVTVTGTISEPGYSLTVNGVEATTNDDGTWEADGVPVSPVGTAKFDVEIYIGDPVNVGSQIFNQPQPVVISLMSYTSHYHEAFTTYLSCPGPAPWDVDTTVNWLYQTGGGNVTSASGIDGDCESAGGTATTSLVGGYNGYSPTWECSDITESLDTYYYNGNETGYTLGSQQTDTRTHVMIVPPEQTTVGQIALYLVQAQVFDEDTGDQIPGSEVQFANQLPGTSVVDVTNDDDSVWSLGLVSAPAAANTEVTPSAPVKNISFDAMLATNVALQIVDANTGANLTAQTNTVIMGQQMNFICQLNVTNAGFNPVLTNFSWTVPGYAISNYVVAADSSSAMVVTNFPLNNSNVVFYWVDGASNRVVQVSATVNGATITGQAMFNIYRPSITFTDEPPSWATNDIVDGTLSLALGNPSGIGSMFYRVDVSSAFSGRTDFTQLINRSAANGDTSDTTSGQYWMDNTRFYLSQETDDSLIIVNANQTKPLSFNDGPSFALAYSLIGGNTTSVFDQFKDYIIFRPDNGNAANNIYVPLGKITWSWSASTTYSDGAWSTPTYSITRPSSPDGGYEFPQWPQTYYNH